MSTIALGHMNHGETVTSSADPRDERASNLAECAWFGVRLVRKGSDD